MDPLGPAQTMPLPVATEPIPIGGAAGGGWEARALAAVLRHPAVVLVGAAVLFLLVQSPFAGVSWHYIVTGSVTLFSADVLRLFALHPELQMGPLTFLLSGPFVLLLPPAWSMWMAMAAMMAAGVVAAWQLRGLLLEHTAAGERRALIAGIAVLLTWSEVAVHYGHLDDVMALLCGVLAVRAMRPGHVGLGALAIGLAIDFKPWALPLVALLLLAPRGERMPALVTVGVIVAAVWLPFAIGGGAAALGAVTFVLPIAPASTLHLLVGAGSTPAWCRPVQLLGGLALAAIAVRSGRWPSALMIVVALRMLVDPTTHNYYDVGLVLGAAIFDVAVVRAAIPIATVTAVALVYLPSYALLPFPDARGIIRTIALVLLIALGFAARPRPRIGAGGGARTRMPFGTGT